MIRLKIKFAINLLTTKNNLYKPKVKTYAKCVKDWANYINGSTNRPKKPLSLLKKDQYISDRTFISKYHSEGTANKPIVNCLFWKSRCPVLFDTGAEKNVIDHALIRSENRSIKFIPANSFLNCANGSKQKILGYARLRVSFWVQHLPLSLLSSVTSFRRWLFVYQAWRNIQSMLCQLTMQSGFVE